MPLRSTLRTATIGVCSMAATMRPTRSSACWPAPSPSSARNRAAPPLLSNSPTSASLMLRPRGHPILARRAAPPLRWHKDDRGGRFAGRLVLDCLQLSNSLTHTAGPSGRALAAFYRMSGICPALSVASPGAVRPSPPHPGLPHFRPPNRRLVAFFWLPPPSLFTLASCAHRAWRGRSRQLRLHFCPARCYAA